MISEQYDEFLPSPLRPYLISFLSISLISHLSCIPSAPRGMLSLMAHLLSLPLPSICLFSPQSVLYAWKALPFLLHQCTNLFPYKSLLKTLISAIMPKCPMATKIRVRFPVCIDASAFSVCTCHYQITCTICWLLTVSRESGRGSIQQFPDFTGSNATLLKICSEVNGCNIKLTYHNLGILEDKTQKPLPD